MVYVERGSIVVYFTATNVESDCLEKTKNIVDCIQIQDVKVEEVLNVS